MTSGSKHPTNACDLHYSDHQQFKCVNCGGTDSAACGGCPCLKLQKRVNSLSVTQKALRLRTLVETPELFHKKPPTIRENVPRRSSNPAPSVDSSDIVTRKSYADPVLINVSQPRHTPYGRCRPAIHYIPRCLTKI